MGRRSDYGSDSKRYYDWLERSEEDLKAAGLLAQNGETLNAAAFHCQQCIEKALKGYILFKTKSHLDGHNLTWLCRQAVKYDGRFTEWLDESAALNRYYIETRYPSDIPDEPDKRTVDRIFAMARDMHHFIKGELH